MSQKALHATTLLVPEYDQGLAFFVDLLEFEVIHNVDLGNGKRWVLIRPPGARESHILLARAVGEQQINAIGRQTGDRVGFFLGTDDFDRDHARMIALGVFFEERPRTENYGKVAVWQDPFGNRWDLLQLT